MMIRFNNGQWKADSLAPKAKHLLNKMVSLSSGPNLELSDTGNVPACSKAQSNLEELLDKMAALSQAWNMGALSVALLVSAVLRVDHAGLLDI